MFLPFFNSNERTIQRKKVKVIVKCSCYLVKHESTECDCNDLFDFLDFQNKKKKAESNRSIQYNCILNQIGQLPLTAFVIIERPNLYSQVSQLNSSDFGFPLYPHLVPTLIQK